MASKQDLVREFGPVLERHPGSLERLLSLASTFKTKAEDLASKWESHAISLSRQPTSRSSSSNNDHSVDLSVPTLDAHFDQLRSTLQKEQDARYKQNYGVNDPASSVFVKKGPMGTTSDAPLLNKENLQDFIDSQILGTPLAKRGGNVRGTVKVTPRSNTNNNAYSGYDPFEMPPPISSAGKRPSSGYPNTPGQQSKRSNLATDTPTSFTPSPLAQKYKDRNNRGAIVEKYGENVPYVPGDKTKPVSCEVAIVPGQQTEGYRYLNEKLADKGDALDNRIEELTRIMREVVQLEHTAAKETANTNGSPVVKMNIEEPESKKEEENDFAPVGEPSQDSVITCGRICVDSSDGTARLMEGMVVLEGSRESSGGDRVKLDLGGVSESGFALFPGQIVVVQGSNPTGRVCNVTKIHHPPPLPLAQTAATQLLELYPAGDGDKLRPINIAIASGPYTLEDSTSFEPLEDLVVNFQKDPPDVVILLGPFIDADHPIIRSEELDVTLEELFAQQISARLERMLANRPSTKIVMVPSVRDAVSRWICFPQPPLASALRPEEANRRRGVLGIPDDVLLLPNPVQLTINEVVVGISTMDVLTHLSADEFARLPPGGRPDRVGRLCKHVLEQRNMYPLIPGSVDEACLDMSRYAALDLQATPDILIFSSALKHFAKNVSGCLCINPAHLAKGRGGGTFVRMCVQPLDIGAMREQYGARTDGQEDMWTPHFVADRSRVDFVKI
ncbi:hypothetical protein SmJEL517_g05350 [Synchytrium microbalum]|uniref:DNA polymerase alpha subunit B n=1 Tax=Synchytrium microbalum TaxID=1806994 RepID=A0A507BPN3_9FUNG|nr:uncharacterized protein SmJEL517_g05350 [Synchytrium microbalum]TPX31297.1 hypothetical protein SmJEL517_g05350 [Synchytrium microbalum]